MNYIPFHPKFYSLLIFKRSIVFIIYFFINISFRANQTFVEIQGHTLYKTTGGIINY